MPVARRAGARLATYLTASTCKPMTAPQWSSRVIISWRNLTTTPTRLQKDTPSSTSAAQQVSHDLSPSSDSEPLRSLTDGLLDPAPILSEDERQVDWTRSFHGLSSTPFTPEQAAILQEPLEFDDIEIKPDGIVYLPEIKYRRKLNRAFGPGGWGLAPRGETIVTQRVVTREYGLVAGGRLVSIARGEQTFFDPDGIPTATEGCKSNALMRCCKDLGIASELWDPRFIKRFMAEMGKETFVEHQVTKKRRKHYMRKDDEVRYPFKDVGMPSGSASGTGPSAAARSPGTGKASGTGSQSKSGAGVAGQAQQAFQKAKAEHKAGGTTPATKS